MLILLLLCVWAVWLALTGNFVVLMAGLIVPLIVGVVGGLVLLFWDAF